MSDRRIELHTGNLTDAIALRGVKLWARLSGMSLKARVEQTFVNQEAHAIEAVYTFPLIEGSAVCGFEVVTGDHVLTGKVEETGDAIEKYESAIADGHGAFLAEQERSDVFTVRVGNLKPKQAATIRITFVAPLEMVEKAIRIAFPTTIAPRYISAAGATDPLEATIDGDALNPPHAMHVPYGMSMEIEVALGRAIRSITSPTHAVQVERQDDESALVTFAGGLAEMDRDVVLAIQTAKEVQPTVQAARWPGDASEAQTNYLAVNFIPDFSDQDLADPPPAETVFVLDCSGSMSGESIQQATAALELCLRSLSPGDTFNICRFGSTFELMAPEPVQYSSKSLSQAIAYVRRGADLGGTELHQPLEEILPKPPAVGVQRQLILLTDGQISNEPAVIDLARKHRDHNRIFTFGIGSACSANLVKGLARATGGAAEFISGAERIEEKVLRVFGRIASPMVSDVKLDWGGAEVQTLAEMPPVFEGEVLTVFARCEGRLPQQVTLQCQTPMGQRRWALTTPRVVEDDGVIATMWARRAIQSLEEVNGVRRTSVSHRAEDRTRAQMIRLSKQFNLLSALTSFICAEHRTLDERNEGRPELRKVPLKLADNLVLEDLSAHACMAPMAMPAPPPMARMMPPRLASPAHGGLVGKLRKAADAFVRARSPLRSLRSESHGLDGLMDLTREADAESSPSPSEPISADPLSALLKTQSAEGSFDSEDVIAKLLNAHRFDRATLESSFADVPASPDRTRIIRTLIAAFLLQKLFAAQDDLWKRAHRKAVRWVASVTGWPAKQIEQRLTSMP